MVKFITKSVCIALISALCVSNVFAQETGAKIKCVQDQATAVQGQAAKPASVSSDNVVFNPVSCNAIGQGTKVLTHQPAESVYEATPVTVNNSSYVASGQKKPTSPNGGGSRDGWIKWCGANIGDGIGAVNSPATYSPGARFLPADLAAASIQSGDELSKVSIYIYSGASVCTFTLNIYQGGTSPTNPGTLVYTQPLTLIDGNNEIVLTTPVEIDASQELWITYQIIQSSSSNPAGMDGGPRIIDKGDIFNDGGSWNSFYTITGGQFNLNWNIEGYVESGNPGNDCPAVTDVTAEVYEATKVKVTWTEPAKALTGYKIYQDNVEKATVAEGVTEWISDALPNGTYTFAVAATFDDGCTPVKVAAAPVEIKTCNGVVSNLDVAYEPDCSMATLTWDAPGKSMTPPVEIPNIVVDRIEEYHIGETVATDRLPAAYADLYTPSVAPPFNLRAVADAYVGNTYSTPNYNSIILETGEKTYVGTMPSLLADETPTGEDYDGTDMYRITNFGRVSMISETGAATDLGNIAGTTNCIGLAYDWVNQDGFFFYDATGTGTYTFTLYKLSVPSLEKTLVGVAPGSAEFRRGLALSSDGYLYSLTTAVSGVSNLFRVDPTNGQPTTVGPIGFQAMYGFDMVFDRVEEILYASPIDYAMMVSKLITLNTTTGASTLIYNYGLLQHAIFSCTKGDFVPPDYTYNIYRDGLLIGGPTAETTFEDTDFDPNAAHTWSVAVACSNGGDGEWVNFEKDACVPPGPEPCDPITGGTATVVCDEAVITWEAVTGAVGYKVSRDGALLETVTEPAYTETGEFEDGVPYTWEIVTVCDEDESDAVEITGVADCSTPGIPELANSVSIYPNPTSGMITISALNFAKVEIYNTVGQLMETKTDKSFEVSYNTGIYFFKVYDVYNNSVTKRVMVTK